MTASKQSKASRASSRSFCISIPRLIIWSRVIFALASSSLASRKSSHAASSHCKSFSLSVFSVSSVVKFFINRFLVVCSLGHGEGG